MTTAAKNTSALGVSAGIGAGLVWGLYPFFYKPLSNIDIFEIISHRVIWSVIFLLPFLLRFTERHDLLEAFRLKQSVLSLTVCAFILSGWWLTYVYCLVNERILEASLGYFLGPILTAVLGNIILKERMGFLPSIAVSVSGLGILIFAMETQGNFPFYGILLGLFYSGYTIFKRGFHTIKPKTSITAEFMLMLPFAATYLLYRIAAGTLETGVHTTWPEDLLFPIIGIINIIPMWWYSYASMKVDSITMSFLQYISPMLNFSLAVVHFGETFTKAHMIMFAFVWVGVGIYAVHSIRNIRRTRLA